MATQCNKRVRRPRMGYGDKITIPPSDEPVTIELIRVTCEHATLKVVMSPAIKLLHTTNRRPPR